MVRVTVYTADGPLAHYDGKDMADAELTLSYLLELYDGITEARFDNIPDQ